MLSQFLANPREGNLKEVFAHKQSMVVFDYTASSMDESCFTVTDWGSFYSDAAEAKTNNAPEPRGKTVDMTCYVDADHAGCRVTRRSYTGILIFLLKTSIIWYSNRQNTVEASTFGFNFIAMKTAVEQVETMRYKLRMMGILIYGQTNVYLYNEAVFKNSTFPESVITWHN